MHYTAENLWDWLLRVFWSFLRTGIDACVYKINENIYKMWYKDEKHDSHTWSAVSSDLYHWDVCGEEISFNSHEGPNVFEFGWKQRMITDEWNGLGVYKTEDFTNWERNGVILRDGGSRPVTELWQITQTLW